MISNIIKILNLSFLGIYNYFFGKKWYIIEGNIGCGKTTLIKMLKENKDIEVIEEPVDVWKQIKNEHDENILGLFYKDPNQYAYLFQTIVFKTRMMSLEKKQLKMFRFSERSIWTDKNIFSKSCYELGNMNTIEKNTYDTWFEWLEQKITVKPDGIIYLRANPVICLNRLQMRNREEESSVTLEYMNIIHNKHEEWLNVNNSYNNIPIYVIDNTSSSYNTLEKVEQLINYNSLYYRIQSYIRNCFF